MRLDTDLFTILQRWIPKKPPNIADVIKKPGSMVPIVVETDGRYTYLGTPVTVERVFDEQKISPGSVDSIPIAVNSHFRKLGDAYETANAVVLTRVDEEDGNRYYKPVRVQI